MFTKRSCYIIRGRENKRVHRLEELLSMLDKSLNTNKKRHLAGGVLLSISLLFGGLALTIMTIKMEETNCEKYIE